MKNLTVCVPSRTIEVSKSFNTRASQYGTPEYNDLQNVRRDYPGFEVVVVAARKATKSNKPSFKGLTYDYMEKYILSHDDEKHSTMTAYMNLRAMTTEAEEACADALSYQEIKTWFLDKYPEISKFHETRAQLVEKAQNKNTEDRKALLQKQMEERRNALLKKSA